MKFSVALKENLMFIPKFKRANFSGLKDHLSIRPSV